MTRTKVGVYKGGAYCNDPIKQPILPKKPTAPERQADAAAYAGKLKEGSWVAVDCTGGTDVHGFWLAQCIAKPYKASADINAPVGMKDIKKGWPVVDIQWWERYDDDDDDDTLFQREGIDDTVHMESLIAVDAPLRRCLGIPAPAGQWTGRLSQTTCVTTRRWASARRGLTLCACGGSARGRAPAVALPYVSRCRVCRRMRWRRAPCRGGGTTRQH